MRALGLIKKMKNLLVKRWLKRTASIIQWHRINMWLSKLYFKNKVLNWVASFQSQIQLTWYFLSLWKVLCTLSITFLGAAIWIQNGVVKEKSYWTDALVKSMVIGLSQRDSIARNAILISATSVSYKNTMQSLGLPYSGIPISS